MIRPIIVFITGLLTITAVTLLSGVVLEPLLEAVVNDQAVQQLGWAADAEKVVDTVNQYAPLLYIVYLLVFAVAWAFRKERVTSRRVR